MSKNVWILSLLLLAGTAEGGENVWTSEGPEGGIIQSITVNPVTPSKIFLTSFNSGQVFRSTDYGDNWNLVSDSSASYVAVDPMNPNRVYVLGYSVRGDIGRSDNEGEPGSWYAVEPVQAALFSIAIGPSPSTDPTASTIYAGAFQGVYRSTNGGVGWELKDIGLPVSQVRCLAVDPTGSGTVYAGTWGQGIYRSSDEGGTWVSINGGIPDHIWEPDSTAVFSIAVNPQDNREVYIGVGTKVSSHPNGYSWSGKRGALLKSTDDGNNWMELTNGLPGTWVYSVVIASSDIVYAATDQGVYKTTNGTANEGAIWNRMNVGLPDLVTCLVIDPLNSSNLYAGHGEIPAQIGGANGFYKTDNGAKNWRPSNNRLKNVDIWSIAVDAEQPDIIYAGARGSFFKTTDGGTTPHSWERKRVDTSRPYPNYDLTVSVIGDSRKTPGKVFVVNDSGVFISEDYGESWMQPPEQKQGLRSLAVTPFDSLFIGSSHGEVFKCDEKGNCDPLPLLSALGDNVTITSIVLHPDYPSSPVVYAGLEQWQGAEGGVLKSENGGNTWEWKNDGLPVETGIMAIRNLVIHPTVPDRVYALTNYNGVYKTGNGGNHWEPTNEGLQCPECGTPGPLAIDPRHPSIMYAGGSRSLNGGMNWQPMFAESNFYSPDTLVTAIAIDPVNSLRVHVGTNRGVFSRDFLSEPPPEPPNSPPVAIAGADTTVACTSCCDTPVQLNGTQSYDPDDNMMGFAWSATGVLFDDSTSVTPTGSFSIGKTAVALTVFDSVMWMDWDTVMVTVIDTVRPSVEILSPAFSDTFVAGETIDVDFTAYDNCDDTLAVEVSPSDPLLPPLDLGSLTIRVIAWDDVGNVETDSVVVEIIPQVSLETAQGFEGGKTPVPLSVDNASGLVAATFEVTYDEDALTLAEREVQTTALTSGFLLQVDEGQRSGKKIRLIMDSRELFQGRLELAIRARLFLFSSCCE